MSDRPQAGLTHYDPAPAPESREGDAGTSAAPVATASVERDDPPVLEIDDVKVHFGGVRALDGVTLQVRSGEVVGLIGPNGSGKTTLFDAVSGLTPATAGRMRFEGDDVTGKPAVWRARWGLRRTFQRQQVFGRLSVEDNLLAATEWRGGGGGMAADLLHLPMRVKLERDRRAGVDEVLELCGLARARATLAGSLPIGTARLLELARALVARPRILLLDEPTSGMSEADAEVLTRAIEQYRDEHPCAVLLVEHDVNLVMSQSHYVYALVNGKVLATGTPREIQQHPEVIAAYLG